MAPRALLLAFVVLIAARVGAAPQPALDADTRQSEEKPPEAEVLQGKMRGATLSSRNGRRIYAFRGIPYATPPVGELRFRDPLPAAKWEGVLDASKDGSDCVQKNYLIPPYPVSGSEDCLFLNVYTPKVTPPFNRLPVIVYIHGGGFFAGSGASHFVGPQFLLDQDVVLVTLNYRLGIFGFLSTGDERAPGNFGLKDQSLALRWVRQNIAVFGGDPECVTIMGQSAGGASVHFHMLSPLSRGLFQRAISQSGTALSAWAKPVAGAPLVLKQAQYSGCDAADMDGALRCLREADAHALAEAGDKFHFWSIDPLTVFRPVVEGPWAGAFLVEQPPIAMQLGAFARVPWLLGSATQEGVIRAIPILSNETQAKDLNTRWDELMPQLLELQLSAPSELIPLIWNNVSNFYFGNTKPPADINNPQPFIDLYSDRAFLHGFRRAAELHARAGHKRIFLYEFAYRGRYSYSQLFSGGDKDYGASHCDDLIYLFFEPALFPEMPLAGSMDEKMTEAFVKLWTNFAKYGDPTPPPTPQPPQSATTEAAPAVFPVDGQCWSSVSDAAWAPYEPLSAQRWSLLTAGARFGHDENYGLKYMHLDATGNHSTADRELQLCMRKGFHEERIDFWRSLPIEENKVISFERILLPIFYLVGVIF